MMRKTTRSSSAKVVSLSLVMMSLCVGRPLAESPPASEGASVSEDVQADILVTLTGIVDKYQIVAEARGLDKVTAALADTREKLLQMTPGDFATLAECSTVLSAWDQNLDRVVNDLSRRTVARAASIESAGLPSANYSAECGSERPTDTELLIELNIFLAAEIVREVALRGCQETVVVLGEGGNASAACIISDAIFFAAKEVYENVLFCVDSIDSAEIEGSYERLGHVHADVATVQSTADDIETKVDTIGGSVTVIIDNIAALEAKADALESKADTLEAKADTLEAKADLLESKADMLEVKMDQLQAALEESMKRDIERHMLDHANLVSLYLPESLGGRLGWVRSIVENWITQSEAAGLDVKQARKFFEAGVQLMDADQYKPAFEDFAKAYRMLTQVERGRGQSKSGMAEPMPID